MPKFLVTLKQTYTRTATVEIEAPTDIAATDKADRLDETLLKWSDLDSNDPEIENCVVLA